MQHPQLSPEETWEKLFEKPPSDTVITEAAHDSNLKHSSPSFTPSLKPAHEEILRLLKENEPDTITIIAIGPLSNLALAAAQDPETFLRVKEVVVMGGAVDLEGNVSISGCNLVREEYQTTLDLLSNQRDPNHI